jgi:hypothetical protein
LQTQRNLLKPLLTKEIIINKPHWTTNICKLYEEKGSFLTGD